MFIVKIIGAILLAMLLALTLIGAIAVFFGILYYYDVEDRKKKEKETEKSE